jgi:hypothetical protein
MIECEVLLSFSPRLDGQLFSLAVVPEAHKVGFQPCITPSTPVTSSHISAKCASYSRSGWCGYGATRLRISLVTSAGSGVRQRVRYTSPPTRAVMQTLETGNKHDQTRNVRRCGRPAG